MLLGFVCVTCFSGQLRKRRAERMDELELVVCLCVWPVSLVTDVSYFKQTPLFFEVFERSRFKSSPLEKPRSKLANPVELTGFDWG